MDSSAITIIGTPISHYVQTVILTCEEKGVPYRLVVEGHDTPEVLRSVEHRHWHPFAKIPAIEHGGMILYETSAICRYIDLVFAGKSLVPEEPLIAARMEQWISTINSYFHRPCISQLVSQYVFPRGPKGLPDQESIDAAMPEINIAMDQLAAGYEDGFYLAGDNISLADLFVAPIIMQVQQTPEGKDCLSRFSIIDTNIQQLAQRPAFSQVQALQHSYLPANNCLLVAE
ncbi:MAG: glutathione S-transferase family protein [Motiliproteus sp.]